MRRIAAGLAVVIGLGLIGFTIGEHLFSRASDAQKISDHYQPLMSRQGLADLQGGFNAVKAAGAQLDTDVEPQLQRALGMDPAGFDAYKTRSMPGIKAFDTNAPAVVALVEPVIGKMVSARADYARAADIPTSWLPLSSAPWLFLGIGSLLVGVGVVALLRPGRIAVGALLVVGLGVALAPLVVGIPSKVDAAVRVTALGRVGLAPSTGAKAVGATKLFDGMVADVQTVVIPRLRELGVDDFSAKYPTLAKFADAWQGSTSAKSHALSDSQVALSATFANADRIPLEPIPWMFIIPGAALAVAAGAALVLGTRTAPTDVRSAVRTEPATVC